MTQIILDEGDAILELRLNRPEKKNALTGAMYDAMADAMETTRARVLLLSAEGDAFCAGNDIGDFLAITGEFREAPPSRFIHALARNDKPMVAAVQGLAVGVGSTMLLHCDLVYAAPEAWLAMPFVDMGLVPEAGSSLLLPGRIGWQRAAAMLLLGERMSAADALAAGLINGVVPATELRRHARAQAASLASKPPGALAAARRLMRGDREGLERQMTREQEAFAAALRSEEAQAALKAFLTRR